jgi:hypothetical protein
VRIPSGRVPFVLLEAEPGSQARGRYDFGYRDAPDEMRIKRPDNFVRIFRLIGDRHFAIKRHGLPGRGSGYQHGARHDGFPADR